MSVAFSLAIGCTDRQGTVLDPVEHHAEILNFCDRYSSTIFTSGIADGYDPPTDTYERTIVVQGITATPIALLGAAKVYARDDMNQNGVGWFSANPSKSYVLVR